MDKKIAEKINWQKTDSLVPAIIQDAQTSRVLMLGYMNKKSLGKTLKTKRVWFFSRTKNRLWMKGEESKNYLELVNIKLDCDNDTLLVRANPAGPTCHTGKETCFDNSEEKIPKADIGIIAELHKIIEDRKKKMPDGSYTTKLFKEGLPKIEAKVMEEAEEVCRAVREESYQRILEETRDVLYHLITLLVAKDIKLQDILDEIKDKRK